MTPNPGEIRRNSPDEQHEYGEYTLVGNDSNGRPRIEHTDTGMQFQWNGSEFVLSGGGMDLSGGDLTGVGSLSAEQTEHTNPNATRNLLTETRTDLRDSFADALDLYLSSPGIHPGAGADSDSNSDFILENGMQLDVFIDSDVTDNVSSDYVSERLKFLTDGSFKMETDVDGGEVALQSENDGPVKIETSDGGNDGKRKQERLVIQGAQRDLEQATFKAVDFLRVMENPKNNDSEAGRLYLGLDSNQSGYGGRVEWTGTRMEYDVDANDHQFIGPNGSQIARLGGSECEFNNRLDFNGNLVRGNGAASRLILDNFAKFRPRSSPPTTPEEGDVAYADGTNWDPGAGKGHYGYDGSAWNKMY